MYTDFAYLRENSNERERLTMLSKMLSRNNPFSHEFQVKDQNSEGKDYTTIMDITDGVPALSKELWLDAVNDNKALNVIEKDVMDSAYYRYIKWKGGGQSI